jgi:hypothetical protein
MADWLGRGIRFVQTFSKLFRQRTHVGFVHDCFVRAGNSSYREAAQREVAPTERFVKRAEQRMSPRAKQRDVSGVGIGPVLEEGLNVGPEEPMPDPTRYADFASTPSGLRGRANASKLPLL